MESASFEVRNPWKDKTERRSKMKYGWIGAFIKFAFAKTSFDYIETEIPGIDMASYAGTDLPKRRLYE